MCAATDPFVHHPELADKVVDPSGSFFRTFEPSDLDEILRSHGLSTDWRLSDEEREASRRAALARHGGADLWIFAYGSLLWDPAIRFSEVRRAHAPGHARRFILKDVLGGRGDPVNPGLMAALDGGAGCDGLAYCIPGDILDAETELLWKRERLVPAYKTAFIEVETGPGRLSALAFVADHDAAIIEPGLSWEDQVRFCATGRGFFGTSLEYAENLVEHFDTLGIADDDLNRLVLAARSHSAAAAQT